MYDIAPGQDEYVTAITVQEDGKIIIAGEDWTGNSSSYRFAMIRFLADGDFDTGFGVGGLVTTVIGALAGASAIGLQEDGKIVLGGFSSGSIAVARYLDNGDLDTSFDSDGRVTTMVGSLNDRAHVIAIQSDGKILAVGQTANPTVFLRDFALVRIWP
jgi:uncharacterized delta-60 repeat protein